MQPARRNLHAETGRRDEISVDAIGH
ncbi:conserved protein of unknown function [Ectopseudomonas oleovorans]|uniref:Uncharacterized protein n=1 Tax=Ectopseudomonas oleovorans TaxID=301 RepID=A0A653B0X8_ECTOL|nr:conserved protein of unknown function [Pseudomonas oleovorans]